MAEQLVPTPAQAGSGISTAGAPTFIDVVVPTTPAPTWMDRLLTTHVSGAIAANAERFKHTRHQPTLVTPLATQVFDTTGNGCVHARSFWTREQRWEAPPVLRTSKGQRGQHHHPSHTTTPPTAHTHTPGRTRGTASQHARARGGGSRRYLGPSHTARRIERGHASPHPCLPFCPLSAPFRPFYLARPLCALLRFAPAPTPPRALATPAGPSP